MNYKTLSLIITYILLLADILSIIPRRRKVTGNCGELKMKLKNKPKTLFTATYIACFLIPLLLFFRNFPLLNTLIICGACILGCEISTRDFILLGIYGVYEKCIISGGITVFYDDIVTFPILNLPEEEQEKYDHANLNIATKSRGNLNMVFANEAECTEATKLIREFSGK